MSRVPFGRITLAVAAAGLLAAAGAAASAPLGGAGATASAPLGGATTVVQSAKGGGLQGDQLTLRGVGRSVRWKRSGRPKQSGIVSFKLVQRQLFSDNAALTADLRVAGQRGAVAVRISRPRYDARRGTVSYRVKRLGRRRIPHRFGAASLSIVLPRVVGGSYGDHSCQTEIQDNTAYGLQPIHSSKGDLDVWALESPPTATIGQGDVTSWESDGALFKGCMNSVVWKFVPDPNSPHPPTPPSGTVSFTTAYPWDGLPAYTCTSSDPGVQCKQTYATREGEVDWELNSP